MPHPTLTDDQPLTSRNQLLEYFTAGAKPKAQWRIGTEHEKFPFRLSTLQPVSYAEPKGIKDLLQVLKIFGWRDVLANDTLIGLERAGVSISLEPGGQVELSGRPVPDLHETAAEIDQHFEELEEVARLLDIGFLGLGFHPTATAAALPWMPKTRFAIMRDYLPQQGTHGLDMMQRTCTVQVNLDYADEADMIQKMRLATALQPIATALFAASPFVEGADTGYQSWRMRVWQDVDPARCGAPWLVFADDFGFERYVDYALRVPMLTLQRHGQTLNAAGLSFQDFMAGTCAALPGERPTVADWHDHLGSLYPDVRLKHYMELRGADCGNREAILALPSFWTGLLYDETARAAAWELVQDWSLTERQALHANVPQHGLALPFRGGTVNDIAHRVVILAQQGLRRRAKRLHGGADETRYLDGLLMITESGTSYASDLTGRLQHQWHGDMQQVYQACRL
jgi:glutamate--cysteine ligase